MKTLVLGLGISGVAAAKFLLKQKEAVLGIDSNKSLLETDKEIFDLKELGIVCQHDSDPIHWSDIKRVVVSPGVHPKHSVYQSAKEKNIEIIGEAELALPHFQKPLIAVTGTNGKTTVVLLIEHLLNAAGIKAKALGNVGIALCNYLMNPGTEEALIVELSSFHLETMQTPVFDAAVLLNITPDHLDRYKDMQEYAKTKFRLQYMLKKEASFYIHEKVVDEYKHCLDLENYKKFGMGKGNDLRIDDTAVLYREKIEFILPLRYREMGRHDKENVLAAWAMCRPFSVSNEEFCDALETFQKPHHRIEFICEIEGVSYFDDSKGTNIDAVIKAVEGMKGPVILIAGGVDKGASYLLWKEQFLGKVKQIIAIGAAAPKIYRELHPYFNIKIVDSIHAAVETAADIARKGDCVLLSPGCSSYDMFCNYIHRGQEFQRCVNLRLRR